MHQHLARIRINDADITQRCYSVFEACHNIWLGLSEGSTMCAVHKNATVERAEKNQKSFRSWLAQRQLTIQLSFKESSLRAMVLSYISLLLRLTSTACMGMSFKDDLFPRYITHVYRSYVTDSTRAFNRLLWCWTKATKESHLWHFVWSYSFLVA